MVDENAEREDGTGFFSTNRRRFLGASAALAGLGATGAASAAGSNTVTVVHDTHFHGRFGGDDDTTIARYVTEVRNQLATHDNAVFFGNGDDLSPSLMGLVYKGKHMVEALNYIDQSVTGGTFVDGAGNHDFDFGVDNATARFRESTFPWVVANLLTPEGEPIPGTQRWTTVDANGVTVGVFGLGVEDFHGITAYPDDYQVVPPVDAAKEATAALREREGADVVVLASHTSSATHVDIAEGVDGLDLIVGSHSGKTFDEDGFGEKHVVNGTVISEVGDQFRHLGAVTLDASTGDLVAWDRIDLEGRGVEPDAGMQKIVDKWESKLDDEYGEQAFRSTVELDARFDTNYGRESRLGNLVTDVFREELDADVGLQNPGGIRSNSVYGPGGVTGADVYNVLPFPNTLVKLELSGATLKRALESGISALPRSDYGVQAGVQISGVQYEYAGHDGEAVVENVYVDNDPLDESATYTLATNDYVAENWNSLADATVVEETRTLLADAVLERLKAAGVVSPDVDDRILRVDEDLGLSERVESDGETVTVTFGAPERATDLYGRTFRALTQFGGGVEATSVERTKNALRVSFDAQELAALATGPKRVDLRVLGGFEPDDSAYGYPADGGSVRDLPASKVAPYYVLKGSVDVRSQGNGPRNWL